MTNQQWHIVGVVNNFLDPHWVQISLLTQGAINIIMASVEADMLLLHQNILLGTHGHLILNASKLINPTICGRLDFFADEDETSEIILINPPYEPLYVRTADGEASIPRRVFYDICKAYMPYRSEVVATFVRLSITFTIIIVLFLLIIKFQVFDEFSQVWESINQSINQSINLFRHVKVTDLSI